MRRSLVLAVFLALLATVFTACGGGSTSQNSTSSSPTTPTGNVFLTGGDSPLPSVLSFNVTINSVTLNNSTTSAPVLTAPVTVDFARLLGLRTLLGFQAVPQGTYTSATITLANPVISFLNLTPSPSVTTLNGTLTTSTVTISFKQPMVVTASGLGGLHLEFDLRQSLQLDGAGQVTGVVNPNLDLRPIAPTDDDAQVDDLRGSVGSVGSSSFVLIRPNRRQFTIDVNGATQFNDGNTLATLVADNVVEVDGTVQNDGSILATEVEVISTSHAYVGGIVLDFQPNPGPATSVTLLVTEEIPQLSGIQVDVPATLNIGPSTVFKIRNFDWPIANVLFNTSMLVRGQRVAVGGDQDPSTTPPSFDPERIVLRRQGVEGDLVLGSVVITSGNDGSFQLQNNGLFGFITGGPLTVLTSNRTRFVNINGLAGIQSGGAMNLRAAGLLLRDSSGNPVLAARRVELVPTP